MKEFIKKLIRLETVVASEKGPFDLFALFSTDGEVEDRWDLVISATWIADEYLDALEYLIRQLRSYLTVQEFSMISKIAPLDVSDPRVKEIQNIVTTEHKLKELRNSSFYGSKVEKMYVITCKLQIDERLMLLMWKTILKMWQSGNKRIESEAILRELARKGEKVPDYTMDRILEYLLHTRCIRGPQYINSTDVRKHGAMTITYVDAGCRKAPSIPMSA